MCNFFSALGMRDGSLRWHPMLDSHSDLLTYFEFKDDNEYQARFVKLELVPGNADWLDPETWRFSVDESVAPVWCNEDMQAAFRHEMVSVARRFILIDGHKNLIIDGCWIIGKAAKASDVRGGRIMRIQDSAQINGVWDSAQINGVRGSAQINGVRGSAQIKDVWDSAQIKDVGDSAQIKDVWDSAQIKDVGAHVKLDDSAKAHVVGTKEAVCQTQI